MSIFYPVDYYDLYLPISKKKVRYRGFSSKEEKQLLLAAESNNTREKFNAVRGVVQGCIEGNPDVSSMPYPEVEFIFLNIRAKSVGEIAEFKVICDCEKKAETPLDVDLSKVPLIEKDGHKDTIELSDRVFVRMSVPTFETVERTAGMPLQELEDELIVSCLKEITIDEDTFDCTQQSKEEIKGFLHSIPPEPREKLDSYFDTMPTLTYSKKYKCIGCDCEKELLIEGLENFFE